MFGIGQRQPIHRAHIPGPQERRVVDLQPRRQRIVNHQPCFSVFERRHGQHGNHSVTDLERYAIPFVAIHVKILAANGVAGATCIRGNFWHAQSGQRNRGLPSAFGRDCQRPVPGHILQHLHECPACLGTVHQQT